MKLKPGVNITGIRPEMLIALFVAGDVYKEIGEELVVTAGLEGKHSATSLHYTGCAVDIRTNYFSKEEIKVVQRELKERLGVDFDVIIETTHIHIEFQPMYHKN